MKSNHIDLQLAEKCGQLIGLLAILPDGEELNGMLVEDLKRRIEYIQKRKIQIINDLEKD
jgi:hypothetical protein